MVAIEPHDAEGLRALLGLPRSKAMLAGTRVPDSRGAAGWAESALLAGYDSYHLRILAGRDRGENEWVLSADVKRVWEEWRVRRPADRSATAYRLALLEVLEAFREPPDMTWSVLGYLTEIIHRSNSAGGHPLLDELRKLARIDQLMWRMGDDDTMSEYPSIEEALKAAYQEALILRDSYRLEIERGSDGTFHVQVNFEPSGTR